MLNSELAKIFTTFADIHEIIEDQNSKFKVRAYRQASLTFQSLPKNITEYLDLEAEKFTQEIPGFGPAIRSKTIEYVKTDEIKEFNQLKSLIPEGLLEILDLKNVGPKKVKRFYQEVGIENVSDLKKAIENGTIEKLDGFGKTSANKILESIEKQETYSKRTALGKIYADLESLIQNFKKCPELIQVELAGSTRRFQETIGDVDVLATGKPEDHQKIIQFYKSLPEIKKVVAEGETKLTAYLEKDVQIDLRVVNPDEFGAALQYFSGNQNHNVKLRTLAKQKGYKISEYGIFEIESNKKVGGEKEEQIYTTLGLQYIPVYLRNGSDEIELAAKNQIPKLIQLSDIKGDLHTHSLYSDGNHSIEEMALKAIELGYEYLAITDHSPSLKVANGVEPERLKHKKAEIEKLKQKLNFPILYGTEVDILSDGSLDYSDQILSEFDVVVASVHSGLEKDVTTRILKAMQNKYVQIIGHPTNRLVNKRESSPVDFKAIFEQAKNTGTFLEINAQPSRLDLPDFYIREAIQTHKIKLSINTDAHSKEGLKFMSFGTKYASRGWATKNDILNTLPYQELIKTLKQKTN